MSELKVFHKSVIGASHISLGKPCQDYSGSFEGDGIQIVVVCDGHGGNTYFRSDKGASFATKITIECLTGFARCVDDTEFVGKAFSITAQPKHNPFVDADGQRLRFEDLNETQQQYAKQARSYLEVEGTYPKQEKLIADLINQIYTAWIRMIDQDQLQEPFNKKERILLKELDITKAYGCTLLAFMKTPRYWLAFQIGDGSIYYCDEKLSWRKPVPDDCTCFLNYTTSLCDSNPLMEFRYAFSGMGDMPIAVLLCSDGVDGSLRTRENLEDFYEQIIELYLDGDDVEQELQSYLPSLSEAGNRDDISIAGILDCSGYDIQGIKKTIELKKKARGIKNEYRTKKNEIETISNRIETLRIKLERQKDAYFMKKTELDEMLEDIKKRETEVEELDTAIKTIKKEIDELGETLIVKKKEFESWKFVTKNEMAELEAEQRDDGNKNGDNEINQNSIQNW